MHQVRREGGVFICDFLIIFSLKHTGATVHYHPARAARTHAAQSRGAEESGECEDEAGGAVPGKHCTALQNAQLFKHFISTDQILL